ncbi:NACHT domain-containing protein [Streptomyces polygonati]|uniref:NACHT domain-containing protein n=1 Tax=Streptomyces polygonati TaxID=1617087 RepID=A0ABV8HXQ3_9ACTN
MTGPVRERLAVVQCGGRQGSGYLLTPTVVLTAAHVVAGTEEVRVTTPGSRGEVVCGRLGSWYREQSGVDVALVAATEPLTPEQHFFGWADRHWADITALGQIPNCTAIGFPYAQRGPGGLLDSEQVNGTYKPGSGLFSRRNVLTVDGTPPAARPDGVSPWAGMSGAAVFVGGVLLGVITADPSGWQHGRLTITPMHRLLGEEGFLAVLDALDFRARRTSPPGQIIDESAEFEQRYGAYLGKHHGALRIFGIDLTARRRATWPLDTAYYSLEATRTALPVAPVLGPAEEPGDLPGPPDSAGQDWTALLPAPSGPMPAEQALAGHKRVLLRGVAGSGKTTLVQWLAVATARRDLGEHLQHLRDLVPYVLPLRTIARRDHLPAPADFLAAVDAPLTPPAGWAEKVLRDGRALVLIDGVDEIDERARERVGGWLRRLLAAYPGNHWLVTSRPSAVADSWLADEGFTELTLSPMSRRDVRAFVNRWHDAARGTPGGDPEELSRLDHYERTLLDALQTKQDLARLAANPLMCGLICALHRDRSGYLPTGRKELYDAALSMLLIRRDRERDLGPQLTEEPQVQLLQKLAYWLVKNRQAEMDRSDAVRLIAGALPSMPTVATAVGDATAVYDYLLNRSGLLREPTVATVDFVHRTFQDYLAARAAVEELDFDLLADNAHHDQWSDVIRMAVAHGRPAERARLLRKIMDRGDRFPDHSTRLHLLATACLEHATELDPQIRASVEARAETLIPPQTTVDAQVLAGVGPIVLELLPGPEGLASAEIEAVIHTAWLIGGDAAVPLLARYAANASRAARSQLALFPRATDPDLYATEVIGRVLGRDLMVSAGSVEELTALTRLTGIRRLNLRSARLTRQVELLAALPALNWLSITHHTAVLDLAPLSALPELAKIDSFGPVRNEHLLSYVKVTVHERA